MADHENILWWGGHERSDNPGKLHLSGASRNDPTSAVLEPGSDRQLVRFDLIADPAPRCSLATVCTTYVRRYFLFKLCMRNLFSHSSCHAVPKYVHSILLPHTIIWYQAKVLAVGPLHST